MKELDIIRGTKSQEIVTLFPGKKIGVLIAGNAGRPAGSLGHPNGSGISGNYKKSFHTQEEDVVASWLQAEEIIWKSKHKHKKFDPNIVFKENLGIHAPNGRPWGMIHSSIPLGTKKSKHTIQGIDFTVPFFDITTGLSKDEQANNYNFSYSLRNKPLLDLSSRQINKVDLVFVYGPNVAYDSKTPEGTGSRTKIAHYDDKRDYPIFKESVKTALKAGLIAMIRNRDDVAVLAPISGGIYSGKGSYTNRKINTEYPEIITEILKEDFGGKPIGDYFEKVILPLL